MASYAFPNIEMDQNDFHSALFLCVCFLFVLYGYYNKTIFQDVSYQKISVTGVCSFALLRLQTINEYLEVSTHFVRID